MADVINPNRFPTLAAQQVVLALVQTGETRKVVSEGDGKALAAELIDLHEKLTAYYRTLPGAQ